VFELQGWSCCDSAHTAWIRQTILPYLDASEIANLSQACRSAMCTSMENGDLWCPHLKLYAGRSEDAFARVVSNVVESLHLLGEHLHDKCAMIFLAACQFPNLLSLEVARSNYGRSTRSQGLAEAKALARLLRKTVNLRRLALDIDICHEMNVVVLRTLQDHTHLQELDLTWYYALSAESVEFLCKVLSSQKCLRSISFHDATVASSLTLAQFRKIGNAISSADNTRTLSLNDIGCDSSEHLSCVAQMVQASPCMCDLSLVCCCMFEPQRPRLTQDFFLPGSLRTLSLMNCNLNTEASLEYIAIIIQPAVNLELINLRYNEMPTRGLSKVLTALVPAVRLRNFDIFGCELDAASTAVLSTFIRQHPALEDLHFGKNRLGDAVIELLGPLESLSSLHHVILGHRLEPFMPSKATQEAFFAALGNRDHGGHAFFLPKESAPMR